MSIVKRAFLLATADRYVVTAINLLSLPILARLLEPAEYGVAVLGGLVTSLLGPLADFGSHAYLVQERELTRRKLRTAFTLSLALTLIIALAIILAAPLFAALYGNALLTIYIQITVVGFLVGPMASPLVALLRRDLAFGQLALVSIPSTLLYTILAILLAAAGFGALSIAIASAASAVSGLLLLLHFTRRFDIFKPAIGDLGAIVRYGIYEMPATMLDRAWESIPFFTLGRLMNAEAVGLFQRASLVTTIPERVLLSSFSAVMLPAVARKARDGGDIGRDFLRALSNMSVVQWPALICLALLAHPAVQLLLGSRWLDAVPVIQILAVAMLANIPPGLVYPTLAATGGIRFGTLISAIFVPFGAAMFALAATHGLLAATASLGLAYLLKTAISLHFVRRHAPFTWSDLIASQRPSLVAALCSAMGPLVVVIWSGSMRLSIAAGLLGGALAAAGLAAGLRFGGHPVYADLVGAIDHLKSRRPFFGAGLSTATIGRLRGPATREQG